MRKPRGRALAATGAVLLGIVVVLPGPPAGARGFCAVDRGGWRTVSFPAFSTGPRTAATFAAGAAGKTLFVSNGSAVLRSLDRGCSWSEVYTLPQLHSAGAPFARADSEISEVVASDVAVWLSIRQDVGVAVPHVVRSVDGGATWQVADAGLRPTESRPLTGSAATGYPVALVSAPSDPEVVYLLLNDALGPSLWVSEDAGATWRRRYQGPRQSVGYRGLAVDPLKARRLWLWAPNGLFTGVEGGRDVRRVEAIPPGTDVGWVEVLHFPGHRSHLLAFSADALESYRSVDGGRSFDTFLSPGIVGSSAPYGWVTRRDEPFGLSVVSARNGVYRQIPARGPPAFEDVSPEDRRPIYDVEAVGHGGRVIVVGRTGFTLEVLALDVLRPARTFASGDKPKGGGSTGREQNGHLVFGPFVASRLTTWSGGAALLGGGMRSAAGTWPWRWYSSVRVTGP